MVEHAAVNRGVAGSSPAWGAKSEHGADGAVFTFGFYSEGLEAADVAHAGCV